MVEFRYLHGAVYIFENPKAQRVKVGMTILSTTTVEDRLRDVNNMWSEIKATCQICGGKRFINRNGYIPNHVVSGKECPGKNELPLEKDVSIAESYVEKLKRNMSDLSGDKKGSVVRIINTLKKRIEKYRNYKQPEGEWKIRVVYYTECAEQVELLSHKILTNYLDKMAPFGEVFICSVSVATEAVETILNQLGLLNSTSKKINEER